MSNYMAIATVTAALRDLLLPAVKQAVGSNGDVGFNRPDPSNPTTPLVNIYLYQITPNTAYRNADLPTRRSDGSLAQRPQAAFDLHYLLTFHGDDTKLQPQLLLGAAVTALQAQPLLSGANIAAGETGYKLVGSGLENQIERIKFTPTALSLEEFSKLWSVFFQVEYSLSAAYQASVVLMESSDIPHDAPPVLTRNLYVVPFQSPNITQVINQAGADQPITAASTLLVQGKKLRSQNTLLLMEGQEFTPATVTDSQITLPIPTTIHAGVQGLQVLQKMAMGNDVMPQHRGFESNIAPFVLRPTITAPPTTAPASSPLTGTNVTLTLSPNIGAGQRAVLLLNNFSGTPPTGYISLPAVATADSSQIAINTTNVPPGIYLVRVQVDGAESLLTLDSVTKQLTGPTVTL